MSMIVWRGLTGSPQLGQFVTFAASSKPHSQFLHRGIYVRSKNVIDKVLRQ